MRELIVTLDNSADISLLQRMIENMKGVIRATVASASPKEFKQREDNKQWIDMLHSVKNEINTALIDMTDERTRYIMSK